MASRYPETKVLDYCFNPVRLNVDDEVVYVPCGKCDGCLLHKANEWSMRLGSEIEDNELCIFFTLTYNNKYLPTFKSLCYIKNKNGVESHLFTCDHDRNIRFNGNEDVLRKEDFQTTKKCDFLFQDDLLGVNYNIFDMPNSFNGIKATNLTMDKVYFPYSSKRDFQLYLKLLRKDLYELNEQNYFSEKKTKEQLQFRYFGISEYGETLLRPHIHAVVLPNDPEVADYLCYTGLFKNWSMCDKNMFQQHCHFADSGCRGYITQYLTCNSLLPSVYKDVRIKPWRLSSKGSAIGYYGYDKKEVCENYSIGVDEYSKSISRLDERYLLRYPKDLGIRLFPKCYEYRKKDFHGLYGLYSIYWRYVRYGTEYPCIEEHINRFLASANIADVQAVKTCFKVCQMMHWHPHTYVYTLDMFYYKNAMSALRTWYEFQQKCTNVYEIIRSYTNVQDYRQRLDASTLSDYQRYVFSEFLSSLGLDFFSIIWSEFDSLLNRVDKVYTCEVSDILADMVKMPKFNEKYGLSPNNTKEVKTQRG